MLRHPWTLRLILSFVALLAVSGPLDIPVIFGWTISPPVPFAAYKSHRLFSSSTLSLRMSTTKASNESDDVDQSFRVLGVCGGIGSGKSTACKLLVNSCNCLAHIDADKVAHSVYAPGSQAVRDVVKEFGRDILVETTDNNNNDDDDESFMEIDRNKLGAIVFAERSAMAKLEAIVWPHVKDRLFEEIKNIRESWDDDASKQSSESKNKNNVIPVVVVEAAILLDAGWDDLLDGVWAVTVPREASLKRLVETRGLSPEEAQKRIDAQESRRGIGSLKKEVEMGTVHCVVSNDGSMDALKDTLQKSLSNPTCWR